MAVGSEVEALEHPTPGPRSSHDRPRGRREAAWAVLTAVVSLAVAVPSLGLTRWDASTPFGIGLDTTPISMQLKTIHEFGWYWTNPDLGYPFGLNGSWFPELNVLHVAIVKAVDLIVDNGFTAGGLYFVAAFPLTGAAMYLLARSQHVSPVAGMVTGVLLANAPGHAGGYGHLYLAQYWVVPVALWLVIEVARGRSLWHGAALGRLPRRAVTVAAVLVVGLSGAYYVGFTLLLLIPAAVARRVVGRPADLLRGLGVALGLGLTIALPLVLATVGTASDLVTGRVPATRNPGESETYAGKLMDLVLPWPQHRLEPLAFLSQAYNGTTRATVEVSALGIVGVAGLVVLSAVGMAALLAGRRSHESLQRWSGLTLVCFLLYTVGGLGSFVAFFGTPQLRTWSRLSVYILALTLLAVGHGLTRLQRRRGPVAAFVVAALVVVLGAVDQTNPAAAPDHAASQATLVRMQAYVAALEAATGSGCGVFQTPVVAYPESGPYLGMDDYDQLQPYLASSGLRFSYGAMRGTARADWMRAVDVDDLPALGRQLRTAGFCALEVDIRGFTPAQDPSARLRGAFGDPVARTTDDEFVAYRLPELAPSTDTAELKDHLLNPVLVSLEAYGQTTEDGALGQPVGPYGGLSVANLGQETRDVRVALSVRGRGAASREVVVRRGDEVLTRATVTSVSATEILLVLPVPRGLTELTIVVDGPAERSAAEDPASTAFVSVRSASSTSSARVVTEQAQVATGWVVP